MSILRDGEPAPTVRSLSPVSGGLRPGAVKGIFLLSEVTFLVALGMSLGSLESARLGEPAGFSAYTWLGVAAALLFLAMSYGRDFRPRMLSQAAAAGIRDGALVWAIISASLFVFVVGIQEGAAISVAGMLRFVIMGLAGVVGLRWLEQRVLQHAVRARWLGGARVLLIRQVGYPFSPEVAGSIGAAGRIVEKTVALPRSTANPEFRKRLGSVLTHLREHALDEVLLAANWSDARFIDEVLAQLSLIPINVMLIADPAFEGLLRRRWNAFGAGKAVELQRPPLAGGQRTLKRLLDIAVAGLALVLLLPVWIVISAAIVIDSRGPVLFRQRRTGFNLQVFHIYKFRTMKVLDDGAVVQQAQRCDARVTRVGRVLRRLSLDELPQLLNVIEGSMSLVGPRPHALAHDLEYGRLIARYSARHKVRPGITGWAQVNGWRGSTPELVTMERRIEHDLWYIDNWSLWLDLKIIFLTPLRVCTAENAY